MTDKCKIILEWQLIPRTCDLVWKRKRLQSLDPPSVFGVNRQVGKTAITAQQQALMNLFFEGTWAATVGPEISLMHRASEDQPTTEYFVATVFPDGRKQGESLVSHAQQQSPAFLSIEEAKQWADAKLREMGCVLVEDRNLGPLV